MIMRSLAISVSPRWQFIAETRPAFSGLLIALYVLSGRWSFNRLIGENVGTTDVPFYYELRLWVVIFLVSLAMMRQRLVDASPLRRNISLYLAAFYAFICYKILTALWAPDTNMAMEKGYEVIIVAVATFSIYQLISGRDGAKVLGCFWAIIVLLTSAIAIAALFKARSLDAERLAVLGGGPNIFGRMMGLLSLTCLYYWSRGGRALLWLPPAVISVGLVILSGSRGSLVSIVLATVCFFLASRFELNKIFFFAVAAVVLSFVLLNYTQLGPKVMDTFESRITNLLIEQRYTAGRGDLYQSAINLGSQHLFVGAGLAAFPALGLGVYPHNIFLEVFCEGGGIGIFLLIMIFGIFLWSLWDSRYRLNPLAVAATFLIVFSSQFSGDFYDTRTLFLFILIALVSSENMRRHNEKH